MSISSVMFAQVSMPVCPPASGSEHNWTLNLNIDGSNNVERISNQAARIALAAVAVPFTPTRGPVYIIDGQPGRTGAARMQAANRFLLSPRLTNSGLTIIIGNGFTIVESNTHCESNRRVVVHLPRTMDLGTYLQQHPEI